MLRLAADPKRWITGVTSLGCAASSRRKITPFPWYAKAAEKATAFYVSIFPDSRVGRRATMPAESPSGAPDSVKVVDFTHFGQASIAMNAGRLDPFNHAVSFVVNFDTQAEIDTCWNALLEGGSAEPCGWLNDRFGVSWQMVPKVLTDMIADADRPMAARAAEAMLGLVKLNIATLRAACEGAP